MTAAAVVSLVAAAGCGYKGPLYLPQAKAAGAKPVIVTPEPAPDRPQPSEAVPPPK